MPPVRRRESTRAPLPPGARFRDAESGFRVSLPGTGTRTRACPSDMPPVRRRRGVRSVHGNGRPGSSAPDRPATRAGACAACSGHGRAILRHRAAPMTALGRARSARMPAARCSSASGYSVAQSIAQSTTWCLSKSVEISLAETRRSQSHNPSLL